MNENKLKQLVAEAVCLDREISIQQERLKDLKARLVAEAQSRLAATGDSPPARTAFTFHGVNGDVARISLPGPSLKARMDDGGRAFAKIKTIAGRFFPALFVPSVVYTPVARFRSEAGLLLGRNASRLIRLCESDSHPRVCFETKQTREASIDT
jgi:hypothetical protein